MNKQKLTIDFIRDNYVSCGSIRHDVISNRLQLRMAEKPDEQGRSQRARGTEWREMTTQDINTLVCECAETCGASITSREVLTALQSSLVPDVHPLRDWIAGCPEYRPLDMPDFIGMMADSVHLADPSPKREQLWRTCFRKWFVGMVAGWLRDEVVNHQVLVLIGRQGIYKTTWLEHLLPPALRPYCSKLANTRDLNKDERLRIAECALINMDEIDSMTPRELNQLKSLITASDVNERAAYAYTKERRVRLASFCASGNRRDFLSDMTGNRRWLPFEVESIDSPFDRIVLYDYLYAQARYLVENSRFAYWFDLDEISVLEEHNSAFRAMAGEEELLPLLFAIPAEGYGEFMTTAQISERLTTYGNIKQPMPLNRLGMVIGQTGYKAVRKKVDGIPIRGWIVYQRTADELKIVRRNDSPLHETNG